MQSYVQANDQTPSLIKSCFKAPATLASFPSPFMLSIGQILHHYLELIKLA
jgi:hypothetical protein